MSERKNEYHSRVSPIVLSGGRCRLTHIPTMKIKNISEPSVVAIIALFLLLRKAKKAPPAQHAAAVPAYM